MKAYVCIYIYIDIDVFYVCEPLKRQRRVEHLEMIGQ